MRSIFKHAAAALCAAALLASSFAMSVVPARAATSSWPVKGASFIPSSPTDFSSSSFQQSVQNFKADGGNTVNFVIPYYQSNPSTTDIGPGYNTPTDAALVAGIQYVHSLGMRAQVSIYLEDYDGEWRALINPGDRNTWYQKYGDVLVHYGQLAQQQNVELYELGAELIDMASASQNSNNTERWDAMIARVRAVYQGALTYSANRGQQGWASELPNIEFWNKLDYIGVSAYYELPGDGSVSSLESGWQNANNYDITPVEQRWGKPVIFTEVGYLSVSGSHNQPWNPTYGGSYSGQEQVNDYQALLDYWNGYSFMQGVDVWWWSPNPSYGGSGNTDYTPQNKPVEQTLKSFWQGGGSGSISTGGSAGGAPNSQLSGAVTPSAPSVGEQATLSASVTDRGAAVNGAIVDVEVYSGSNRVFQQFFANQNFSDGQTQQYTADWTPGAAGNYTLKLGVFNSDWSQNYAWDDAAATIAVGAPSSGSGSPPSGTGSSPGSSVTDIWWPTDGTHLSGVQPFKALVENTDTSQYDTWWQVGGGALVPMYDSSQDWPHKEAIVDLSGWNWEGSGPYTITFVSKDKNGNVISQKSVQIYTQ